jgi:hypothetical protein
VGYSSFLLAGSILPGLCGLLAKSGRHSYIFILPFCVSLLDRYDMAFTLVHSQMKPIYQPFVLPVWSCWLPHLIGGDITGPIPACLHIKVSLISIDLLLIPKRTSSSWNSFGHSLGFRNRLEHGTGTCIDLLEGPVQESAPDCASVAG